MVGFHDQLHDFSRGHVHGLSEAIACAQECGSATVREPAADVLTISNRTLLAASEG
jgi:hypothetical protein